MFDNFYTKYEDTNVFISEVNALEIIKTLEKEAKCHKLTPEKYAYLSKACIFNGDEKKAIKYARASIKADKNYAYGYLRLAFAYAKLGNKQETIKYSRMAEKLNISNFLNDVFIAIFEYYCGDKMKARKILRYLEKNCDDSAPYLYNLGFLYMLNVKDYERAQYYYQKALDADYKDKYNLYSNLAECYSELQDIDNTNIFVDKCLEIKETYQMLMNKVDCLTYKDEYKDAEKVLRRAYKKTNNKLGVLIKLADVHSKAQMPQKALRIYNFALKTIGPDENLYYYIASLYEDINDYEKAIETYNKRLKINRKNASTYSGISYCYSQMNNNEEALRYVDKALALDNTSSYTHYRKARVLTDMKEYEKAIESFINALDYDNSDTDCYQWISYCYSMMKDFEKSLEFANRAIILDKDDAYSYFRKAWALQEMNKYPAAIEFYEECIKRNDRYIDAYANISYIYSKTGNIKQSMLYANKALLINKDYAYAHYRKAWANQQTGNYEEALDGYSKAIELDPTDIYNYLGIACISLNTQANVNALLYANKALLIDRKCGGAYYYKSLALSNLGKNKEAEKAFNTAVQLGYKPV